MAASARAPVLEYVLLGALALLWGSSYLFTRIAVAEIPPLTLVALRVVFACALLLTVVAWRAERIPRDLRTWRRLLVQAMLNSILAWPVLAWGQQHVPSGLASVLNSTSPIFVILFGVIWIRDARIGKLEMLGAAVGMAGVVLVIGPGVLASLGMQIAGQAAALAGAALYAAAALYGRRLAHLPSTVTAAGTMLCASVCLVPLSLAFDQPWRLAPSASALLAAVVLGLACTGVALMIYFRLLKTLGSLGVASQSYLRAGLGVALGIAFLGERFSITVAFGLLTVIAGVVIINRPK